MARWARFQHAGKVGFGTLQDEIITVHEGDMFSGPQATSLRVALRDVKLLTPAAPTKMVALWNNYHALATKLGNPIPAEPLYLLKANSSFLASGESIRRPESYGGKVVFEGELGVVIGKVCKNVSAEQAGDYVFGYTCVNDVTAAELINKDALFAQWDRAKGFDTFGVFGPVVATDLDPAKLVVKSILNGEERQNYPASDMIFPPAQLVSEISRCMTLYPGDIIACGTSVGVGSMKPGSRIEIVIDGIGTLSNIFE